MNLASRYMRDFLPWWWEYRLSYDNQLQEASNRFKQDLEAARGDWHIEKRRLEKVIQGIQEQYEEMHKRYLSRESRPEDLKRVAELESSLIEADVARKRALVSTLRQILCAVTSRMC
jgi:hypothetical protein